jgi:hypothetical protein
MRCSKCNYRLWNLKSRKCPECGTPFLPSEFEFIPNSVRFCCPHCNQAYYGTGPKGHLAPIEFDCASCGEHIHMDEMALVPAAGVEEEQTRMDFVPWLERRRLGVVKAWFSTIGMAMVNPHRLMRTPPSESSYGEAWWFAVVTNVLIVLVGFAPFVLLPMMVGIAAPGGGRVLGLLAGAAAGVAVGLIIIAVATVFVIAIWGNLTHALLHLTGETAGNSTATCQAICYSVGANILTAVPCLGAYIGWIWWLVSAVLMVKEAQRVQGWRAALAVLTLPVVAISALVMLYAVLTFWAITASGPFGPNPTTALRTEANTVLTAVSRYAEDHEAHGPDHAIELVSGDYLRTTDFISSRSSSYPSTVPVAATNLAQFDSLPPSAQDEAVRAAINALPEGTVAHRLGDFVFTHHGIDLSDPDPRLWIVVMTPDPDVNASSSFGGKIALGLADGTVLSIPSGRLSVWLKTQNDRRAEHGLAPLPDPKTVTHGKPAVGGP